jgi:long-chain acyl-CoA synthetase
VGKVVPGVELRLAEDGEILVRGDSIASGYWRSPELTRSSFEDGWYLTGDIGEMDAQGFLRLRGRKKDVIVLDNGMNVYAQDVEEALKAHASVRDAAVFGVRSRAGRTAIHSVLLLAGEGAEPRLIAAEVNRNLSEHQRIQDTSVWPLEDFPRTNTLKVKKREIADWLRSAQVAEPV